MISRVLLGLGALALAFVVGAYVFVLRSGSVPCDAADRPRLALPSLCLEVPWIGRESSAGGALLEVARRSGLILDPLTTALAALFVERFVDREDRARLARAADADVRQVEQDFGRSFKPEPAAFVFASPTSFAYGLQTVLGHPVPVAQSLARHGGVFDPVAAAIFVNWQLVRAEDPVTVLRHELAHAMIRQIVGPRAVLPAWLEEGLASVTEQTARPGRDAALEDSYVAGALAAGKRASLARLVTSESWIRESAALAGDTYPLAATAARTLEGQIGGDRLQRILDEVGTGSTFETAFEQASGSSVARFVATFGELAAAAAPPAQIAVDARPDPNGDLTWRVRGFTPGNSASVTIAGTTDAKVPYRSAYAITVDARGMYAGTFGSTAPKGTYAISVQAEGKAVSAVLQTD